MRTQQADIEAARDLDILFQIERDSNATQASIAEQLGMAVGTVNWHLKQLISRGCVSIQRGERRKLRYTVTPEGLATRDDLMKSYIHDGLSLFRLIRDEMARRLEELAETPHRVLFLDGESDVAEICRLVCADRGWRVAASAEPGIPRIRVVGLNILNELEEGTVGGRDYSFTLKDKKRSSADC